MEGKKYTLAAKAGRQLLASGRPESAVPYLQQALQCLLDGAVTDQEGPRSQSAANTPGPADKVDKNKQQQRQQQQRAMPVTEEPELPRRWQQRLQKERQERGEEEGGGKGTQGHEGQDKETTTKMKSKKNKSSKKSKDAWGMRKSKREKGQKAKRQSRDSAASDASNDGGQDDGREDGDASNSQQLQELGLHRLLGRSFLAMGNPQMAGQHHEAELRIAKEMNNPLRTALAYGNMGNVFAGLRSLNEAIKCFEKQLQIGGLLKHRRLQLLANESLGAAYRQACLLTDEADLRSRYLTQAERYYGAAAKLARREKQNRQLVRIYGRLATLCEQVHALDRAEHWYKKRLALAEQRNDKALLSRTLCNLGNVYRAQDNLSRALRCYKRDLKLCRKAGDMRGEAVTRYNMGTCHQAAGDAANTLTCLQQHLALAREIRDVDQQKASHLRLGHVHRAAGQYELSLQHYHDAERLAEESGDEQVLHMATDGVAAVTEQVNAGRKALSRQDVAARLASVPLEEAPIHKRTIRGTISARFRRRRPSITATTATDTAIAVDGSRLVAPPHEPPAADGVPHAGPIGAGSGPRTETTAIATTAVASKAKTPDQGGGRWGNGPGQGQVLLRGASSRVKKRLSQLFLRRGDADLYLPSSGTDPAHPTSRSSGSRGGGDSRGQRGTDAGAGEDEEGEEIELDDLNVGGAGDAIDMDKLALALAELDSSIAGNEEGGSSDKNTANPSVTSPAAYAHDTQQRDDDDDDDDADDVGDDEAGLGLNPQHEAKSKELLAALTRLHNSYGGTGESDRGNGGAGDDGEGVVVRRRRTLTRADRDSRAKSYQLKDYGLQDELSI